MWTTRLSSQTGTSNSDEQEEENKLRIVPETWTLIEEKLRLDWSP